MAQDSSGTDDTVAQPPSNAPTLPVGTDATAIAGSLRPATVPLAARLAGGAVLAPLEGERYTLRSRIGQGGMGEVVLAYDEQIGREVAVKRIRASEPSAEELSRFLREARVQGRLEHPAVVPVHDLAFDKDGKPYFVMKRLAGTTLAELLADLRSDDAPDADGTRRRLLRAFVDICLAIEFAHSAGIIHRDLKPANIMLGDFGEVYVLDWGVARAVTEPDDTGATPVAPANVSGLELDSGETRAGTVLGTPAYMAPEQLAGERTGPAADIYALGCMLYEITSGELLHEGRRSLVSILRPIDARPSRRRPDAPPELDAICERATVLEPEARYPTARALGDAVQAFLDGDRDLAMRKALAQTHVAAARAALAGGADAARRREAMQAAGRALALDPTATEAASLVTRLMLEPPAETPPEVVQEVARRETDTARAQGRLAALTMLGYLGFVPLLLWTGVRDVRLLAAFCAVALLGSLQVWRLTRRDHIWTAGLYLNACTNALLIGLVCRLVGPFIIAPTLVTTTLMAYAAHPGFGRLRILATILGAGVGVPWLLEILGVLAPTYRFANGELVIFSPNIEFSAVPVQVAFVVLLVALSTVVALLTRVLAQRQREAAQRLEVQAWHLRQILPMSTP